MDRSLGMLALLGPIFVAFLILVAGCTYLRIAQIRHYERFPVSKVRRRRNAAQ